jgi:hypothetical protein
MVFSLEPGQRIVMRAPSGSVRILPPSTGVFRTTPFKIITVVGANLVAVRPVQFRLNLTDPNAIIANVCASSEIIDAAQAAGAATP